MQQLDVLFANSRLQTHKRGSILIRPEDAIAKILYLTTGYVRQYLVTRSGDEVSIHIYGPGSFFPIMIVLSNATNRFFFEASTDIEVKSASPDRVIELLQSEPKVLYDLTKRFAKGLDGLVTRIEHTFMRPAEPRIVSFLLYLSNRFGEDTYEGRRIRLTLTHQDIANWLGLTRETVSRQLGKLKRKGLISYHNEHIVVIRFDKLQAKK